MQITTALCYGRRFSYLFSNTLSISRFRKRTAYRKLLIARQHSLPVAVPRILEDFPITPMESISDVSIKPITSSPYIQPQRLTYTQNNKIKTWDVISVHDSVAILVHNVTRNVFIFVRQFRPAVYLNHVRSHGQSGPVINHSIVEPSAGFTYELCAGIIDKEKSVVDIAMEEVLEECGYKVTKDCMEEITVCRSSVGISGAEQTLYYARVTDSMRVGKGGGNPEEGELIEVVEIPVSESIAFVMDKNNERPVGMMFAIMWFHHFKSS